MNSLLGFTYTLRHKEFKANLQWITPRWKESYFSQTNRPIFPRVLLFSLQSEYGTPFPNLNWRLLGNLRNSAASIPGVERIMLEELQTAVGSAKSGKPPDLDGFTVQYYKILLPALGLYLVKMLNILGDSASLHRDSLKAIISVIPMDGKDPM